MALARKIETTKKMRYVPETDRHTKFQYHDFLLTRDETNLRETKKMRAQQKCPPNLKSQTDVISCEQAEP